MLYRATLPLVTAVGLAATVLVWLIWLDPIAPSTDKATDAFGDLLNTLDTAAELGFLPFDLHNGWRLSLFGPIVMLLIYGMVHYRFVSKRILANHKYAEGIRMASHLKGLRISMIYVLGTTIAYTILLFGIIAIVGVAIGLLGPEAFFEDQLGMADPLGDLPRWLSLGIIAVLYLSIFLFWSVLHHVFVTYPLMRHMALTLTLVNVAGLAQVSQRARDEFAEAEGFAEALDLGAAI